MCRMVTGRCALDLALVREVIDRTDDRLLHGWLPGAVAGLVDHDQPALGPCPVEEPRGFEGRAKVDPAMHENAGYTGQTARITQQRSILEKGGVVPVVRHQTGIGQSESRVVVARVVALI